MVKFANNSILFLTIFFFAGCLKDHTPRINRTPPTPTDATSSNGTPEDKGTLPATVDDTTSPESPKLIPELNKNAEDTQSMEGSSEGSSTPPTTTTIPSKTTQGFIFFGVNDNYDASELYYLNLMNDQLSVLLSGESGDPVLFPLNDELIMFNRTFGNTNFRQIKFSEQKTTIIGEQKYSDALKKYDPHHAMRLDQETLLLANYSDKSIALINTNDLSYYFLPLDDLDSGPIQNWILPEAFYLWHSKNSTFVAVASQGYDLKSGIMTGGQRLFVFEYKDKKLQAIDLDPGQMGVQGISLTASLPQSFDIDDKGNLFVAGLCLDYFTRAKPFPCQGGVDIINLDELKILASFKLSDHKYSRNSFQVALSAKKMAIYSIFREKIDAPSSLGEIKFAEPGMPLINILPIHQESDFFSLPFFSIDKESETIILSAADLDNHHILEVYQHGELRQSFNYNQKLLRPYSGEFVKF